MEKSDKKNKTIQLTFLEINPPINEIVKNKEEINVIFQDHGNFYDFKKYLSSKIPISLNRYKKSLIITLLKSNNILATGLFTVRPGEQNVIFNYEDNKKIIQKKPVKFNNLLDCIKIKILCEFANNYKDCKDKSAIGLNNNSNNNKNINNNDGGNNNNKYVPKVNLMKTNHLKSKNNNLGKNNLEKKKKYLGNFYSYYPTKKNISNLTSNSQDFFFLGQNIALNTEERNINNKLNYNYDTTEVKKLNPYGVSKLNLINNFSNVKKHNKQNFASQIKLNNSSLNLMNTSNNLNSIDNNNNSINNLSMSNRNTLKPCTSFNKNYKRNIHHNKINNTKNNITSLDNFIKRQIIEHVDKSKNNNTKITKTYSKYNTNTNSDKKNNTNIYKSKNNLNKISGSSTINNTINNDNKKRKFNNNNNITMNSISTSGTKKNELEFSTNSLPDYEDKFNSNKNSYLPFSNRENNEKIQQKTCGANTVNRNDIKYKCNNSLCQQSSSTDKTFNENEFLNLNNIDNHDNKKFECYKSYEKLRGKNLLNNEKINDIIKNDINDIENKNIIINSDNNKKYLEKVTDNNNNDEGVEEEELEMDNFSKIKEDFNLLYNEEYIKKINEDLLKLEIELFIEKMSELFFAYHLQMDEKILENQIVSADYKRNVKNYLLYKKLYNKFQFIKSQKQAKKFNFKEKNINLDKQNFANVNVNMNELNIFKLFFPDDNKSKKLKIIISTILKKKENMELLGEKLKMLSK